MAMGWSDRMNDEEEDWLFDLVRTSSPDLVVNNNP